jgi:hypothetical protein
LTSGLITLAVGGVLVAAAAVIAGDWWLARQPLIGIGLDLLVLGLGLTAVFGAVSVVLEQIGWLRLLAVPPVAVAAVGWFFLLAGRF